jgi:hypothetical protein
MKSLINRGCRFWGMTIFKNHVSQNSITIADILSIEKTGKMMKL